LCENKLVDLRSSYRSDCSHSGNDGGGDIISSGGGDGGEGSLPQGGGYDGGGGGLGGDGTLVGVDPSSSLSFSKCLT